MVKSKKCRMVSALPDVTYFKPAGIPLHFLTEIHLSIEEAEALRLKDLEGLEQVEGAASMEISRSTFQRVLSSARTKVADALLNGKAIRIEGGSFQIISTSPGCLEKHLPQIDAPRKQSAKCPFCAKTEALDQPSDVPLRDTAENNGS